MSGGGAIARDAALGGDRSLAARALAAAYGQRWRVLPPATAVAMFALLAGATLAAPREAVEGEVQRLFYIHVPSALASYGAFSVVFVASVLVLWKRDMRFDALARAAAGVGVLFTGLTLATGAIWGKPIWGVYWTWDARLTSTLVLFLIYSGYLLVRGLADRNDEQAARYAAVLAIIGFVDIPIIHFAVDWWRTLHPQRIVFRPDHGLPHEMLAVMVVGVVAIGLLATWLIALHAELDALATRAQSLRAEVDRAEGA